MEDHISWIKTPLPLRFLLVKSSRSRTITPMVIPCCLNLKRGFIVQNFSSGTISTVPISIWMLLTSKTKTSLLLRNNAFWTIDNTIVQMANWSMSWCVYASFLMVPKYPLFLRSSRLNIKLPSTVPFVNVLVSVREDGPTLHQYHPCHWSEINGLERGSVRTRHPYLYRPIWIICEGSLVRIPG